MPADIQCVAMGASLETFRANIHLLMGLLFFLAVGVVFLIVTWTGIKLYIRHVRERREQERWHREHFRPDGLPYPPASRGLCDRCGGSFEKVYYLSSGERLCPKDYEAEYGP
jgi:hypothetical protein